MRISDFKKQILAENKQLERKLKTDMSHQVAKLLIEARLYKGLTQSKLAELAGTKQPSVARLESGVNDPNLGFLQRLVEAMSLTLLPPRIAEIEKLNSTFCSNASTYSFNIQPNNYQMSYHSRAVKTITSETVTV